MIPRVNVCTYPLHRSEGERSAFVVGARERPLKVIIDADSFTGSNPLLDDLLAFDANKKVEFLSVRLAEIQFVPGRRETLGDAVLEQDLPDGRWFAQGIGAAGQNIETVRAYGQSLDFDADPKLRERLALGIYASRARCDALVTDSPQLQEVAKKFWPAANVGGISEAFAVLGLYLRLRDDYLINPRGARAGFTHASNFYGLLAQCALPKWWRWQEHCPKPKALFAESAGGLANALAGRIARALKARDRAHGYLFRDPAQTKIDEALFYFDVFLVAMVGAFDAAARVVHQAYELEGKDASFRKRDWKKQLCKADAAFEALFKPESRAMACLDALARLRNLLHAEPLSVVGFVEDAYSAPEYHAAVPVGEREPLTTALRKLGSIESFGIDDEQAEFLVLDPHRYVEGILPIALDALNEIMQLTAVERFGVAVKGPFAPPAQLDRISARLKLLGGL